jgi:LemA protein
MASGTIFLIILALLALICVVLYNGLISKRVATENAWSQIDVQLKRRHDLVPNLVETVKGFAAHERETMERVINARNAAVALPNNAVKDLAGAENALSGALRQLFAVSENYPTLKANENFVKLQEELSSTENRIGFARQHFNDSVAVYNTALQTVPTNFIASFGSFKPREFFEIDAAQAQVVKQAPQVSF